MIKFCSQQVLVLFFIHAVLSCTSNPWQIVELLTNLTTPQYAGTELEIKFRYTCYKEPQIQLFTLLVGDEIIAYEKFFFSEHIIKGVHHTQFTNLAHRLSWEYIPEVGSDNVSVVIRINPLKYTDIYRIELAVNFPNMGVGFKRETQIFKVVGGPTFCSVNRTLPNIIQIERNTSTVLSNIYICGEPRPQVKWRLGNISKTCSQGELLDATEAMYGYEILLPALSREYHLADVQFDIEGLEKKTKLMKINMTTEPLVIDDLPSNINIVEGEPLNISSIHISGNPAPTLVWNISNQLIGTVHGQLTDDTKATYEYNISLPALSISYNGTMLQIRIIGYKEVITRVVNLNVQANENPSSTSASLSFIIIVVSSTVFGIAIVQIIIFLVYKRWKTNCKDTRRRNSSATIQHLRRRGSNDAVDFDGIDNIADNIYEKIKNVIPTTDV